MPVEIVADIEDARLFDKANWRELPKDRFMAVRNTYLVNKVRSANALSGPIILEQTLPAGTVINYQSKISTLQKNTRLISSSIQNTIGSKWSTETTGGISGSLGPLPASLTLQSKLSAEFSQSLSAQIGDTRSYEIEINHEFLNAQQFSTPAAPEELRTYYFYLPVWQWHYDIYLYKQERLELAYKRPWVFRAIRKTFISSANTPALPLARVTFHMPQQSFPSIQMPPFKPEIEDAETVTIEPLIESLPGISYRSGLRPLEELAKIAFPASQVEKKTAGKLKSGDSTPRTGHAGRANAKKPAKRSPGRPGSKNTGKKPVPKKPAARRAAPKKAAPGRKK